MEHLPTIDSRVETLRLVFGSFLRLIIYSVTYYTGRGLFSQYVLRRRGSVSQSKQSMISYVASQGLEIGVSVIICPVRYLAAVTTPRFLFDYTLTGWSEILRTLDLFSPGRFASYAVYAFSSTSEWDLDFFVWQMPSVALTLAKLWYRRRHLGTKKCCTTRVLLMLPLQILLRAYLSSFSVMIPECGEELLEAIVSAGLEAGVSAYIIRNTSPFVEENNKLRLVGTLKHHSIGSQAGEREDANKKQE
ncbi:uncharacterized protein TEOVI_000098800 [Trypanosoma equiperdum]|uniref:Uncharacterized protein n=2 Tax=Trypanozoon TaxID=39700 RepID=Q585W6_TRYB2|nr:hypothetical protein, conserved [Trypanosoma brucei brucei TREU927]AAX80785.1 hypothetical protein, conserved [Trypanosoma brucei]AAZ11927.1 hypothetical protein, conserved [Trypanosoma brucei brucei TREU927]SCU69422.1 hypothetical protein, conserved [Trypanosoma equiperdum]